MLVFVHLPQPAALPRESGVIDAPVTAERQSSGVKYRAFRDAGADLSDGALVYVRDRGDGSIWKGWPIASSVAESAMEPMGDHSLARLQISRAMAEA